MAGEHAAIIRGAADLTSNLQKAGLKGPFVVDLTRVDGDHLRIAVGKSIPVTNAKGICKCTTGGVDFRWPAS
jgi:hypothetical protein